MNIDTLVDETPIPRGESWRPVDLAPFLSGDYEEDRPTVLARSDGRPLLYPGRLHSVYAEPEGFKSWVALEACRQEIEAGNRVVFVDYEDSHRSVLNRFRALGADDQTIIDRFSYIRPSEKLTDDAWQHLENVSVGSTLVVIDGMTEAMVIEGLNLVDNSDVAKFLEALPRRVARLGPALLILDHVGRDREGRGRFAIGAQAKLAGLDGAAFSITVTDPFGRNRTGRARLLLRKDRIGYVSEHAVGDKRDIAEIVATSDGQNVTVTLNPPADPTQWKPTRLMQQISETVETSPGISQKQITDLVPGRREYKLQAITALVADGFLRVEAGPRNSLLHYSTTAYREPTT